MDIDILPRDRRRSRRFRMQAVVHLKGDDVEITAVTENISSHGVYLVADSLIRGGSEVEVIVELHPHSGIRGFRLSGFGRVLRAEPRVADDNFGIAVGLDRPFTEFM